MADEGSSADLAYVGDVLSGAAPTGISIPQRGRGHSGSGRSRTKYVQQAGRRGASQTPLRVNPVATVQAESSSAPSHALNRPSSRSTQKVLHCEACDVFVPPRPGDWETHVNGIRHRRQLLSLQAHGERGHRVQSVFESAPESQPAHRIAGKSTAQFGFGPPGRQAQAAAAPAISVEEHQAAEKLRTAALAQLLNMFGREGITRAAAAHFEVSRLLAVRPGLMKRLVASKLCAIGHLRDGRWCRVPRGIDLALVSQAIRDGWTAPIIDLFLGPPAGGEPMQLAGLQLLIAALAVHPGSVETLIIQIDSDLPEWRQSAMLQGWRHVLQGLRSLLERNTGLRTLDVRVSTGLRSQEFSGQMLAASQAAAPGLLEASRAAMRAARTWLLPRVLHPRCGRCSLLQLLPVPLLLRIVELAAPLEGCHIAFNLQTSEGLCEPVWRSDAPS